MMDENNNKKYIIYDADSFDGIVSEINTHIEKIKSCFNDQFTLESYKGSKADKIELSINNILSTLEFFMNGLDNIPDSFKEAKTQYEEVIKTGKIAVNGGDANV